MRIKQRIIVGILAVVFAVSLVGCGAKENEKDAEKDKASQIKEEIKVMDSEKEVAVDNIFAGVFSSSYGILDVTITIMNSDGGVVEEVTYHGTEEMNEFDLSRILSDEEQNVLSGEINLDALQNGEYRCVHTCRISTEETIVVRDFKFVKN